MKPDPVVARLAVRQEMHAGRSEQVAITPIAHADLTAAHFPKRGATFDQLQAFGYSFDGYAHFGMERCAELANAALSHYYHNDALPDDLDELRACMFFEARRWLLYEQAPDTKANLYMFALIDAIKAKLEL